MTSVLSDFYNARMSEQIHESFFVSSRSIFMNIYLSHAGGLYEKVSFWSLLLYKLVFEQIANLISQGF